MTKEQKIFRNILNKHAYKNRTFFTSNDFHTVWNALEEYKKTLLPISIKLDKECITLKMIEELKKSFMKQQILNL